MATAPTNLTLPNLDRYVEELVAEQMPRMLLDLAVGLHTRRGVRGDCDCEYCLAKKHATARFRFAVGIQMARTREAIEAYNRDNPRAQHRTWDHPWSDDGWAIKWNIRDRIRREVRAELAAIKEKVE